MVEWFEVIGSKKYITGLSVDKEFKAVSSFVSGSRQKAVIVLGIKESSISTKKDVRASIDSWGACRFAEKMGGTLGRYGFGTPPKTIIARRRK